MSKAKLQGHQQDTLRAELATERYAGLSADDAYAEVTARPNALRLARTQYGFDGEDKQKTGGFPNKVRRADFDLIWKELTDGSA